MCIRSGWKLRSLSPLSVIADWVEKRLMWRRFRRMIDGPPETLGVASSDPAMFFLRGSQNPPSGFDGTSLTAVVRSLKACRDALQARGIRCVFMPIPDIATVYRRMLPARGPSDSFANLAIEARAAHVTVIETHTAFEEAAAGPGRLLYHTDDPHPNARGMNLCADSLEKWLRKHAGTQQGSDPSEM